MKNKLDIRGDKNTNYIDGRSSRETFCIDCDKKLKDYRAKRCRSCARKELLKISGKHHSWLGDKAKSRQLNYCLECGIKINYISKKCKSCANKLENNPSWKGGKSFEEYGREFNNAIKEEVRFRDKYVCQKCGCPQLENCGSLDVHHIDYDK